MSWTDRAACVGHSPELWFAGHPSKRNRALAICSSCPVTRECHAHALRLGVRFGVWGGCDLEARRRKWWREYGRQRRERSSLKAAASASRADRTHVLEMSGAQSDGDTNLQVEGRYQTSPHTPGVEMTNSQSAAKVETNEVAAKSPAKRAPAKRTATVTKLDTAKAASKTETPKKAAVPKLPYSATGRSGKVATRQFSTVMTHAVDVADPENGRTDAAKKGLIWQFFPNKERAEAWAEKKAGEGYDTKVVPARAAN